MADIAQATPNESKRPWHPRVIVLVTLFSPPAGGILHALNYSRLGLPSRVRPVLIRNLSLGVIIVLISLRSTFIGWADFQTKLLAIFLVILLTVSAAAYFYRSQIGLFRSFTNEGIRAAGWLQPCLIGLTAIVIYAAAKLGVEQAVMRDFYQGVALVESERYKEAEPIFLRYMQHDPRMVEAYYSLAIIYMNTDRNSQAKALLTKILRMYPDDSGAKELLEEIQSTEKEQASRVEKEGASVREEIK